MTGSEVQSLHRLSLTHLRVKYEEIIIRQHLFSNGSRWFTMHNILQKKSFIISFQLPFNPKEIIFFIKKLNLSYYHKYLSLSRTSIAYNHIHHFIHIQHVAWIRNFFRKNKSTQIHVNSIIISMAALLPDFTR